MLRVIASVCLGATSQKWLEQRCGNLFMIKFVYILSDIHRKNTLSLCVFVCYARKWRSIVGFLCRLKGSSGGAAPQFYATQTVLKSVPYTVELPFLKSHNYDTSGLAEHGIVIVVGVTDIVRNTKDIICFTILHTVLFTE